MAEKVKNDESRSFKLKVNGIEIEVSSQKLIAKDILKFAEEKGAIPGKAEGYILQGDKGQYKDDDLVDLEEDSLFITIPDKPTPVA